MKSIYLSLIILFSLCLVSCKNDTKRTESTTKIPEFKNNAHKLVYGMMDKVGDYNKLASKKDVVYTYTYQTPDGKKDVSTEKYIFDGELSYGKYETHERTFPDLEGTIEQGYDGKNYWLKHNGEVIEDADRIKRVKFNRPTNYYWFTMWQKLMDPGLSYEYVKEETINDKEYDVVKITFESTDGMPKDIYQLYINKATKLVDQFLFTVADFGLMEPKLMMVTHENIDGLMIPTKRKYKDSTWDADVSEKPWINVTWTNINFDNELNPSDFAI